MADISMYITCEYCGQTAKKKHHNTSYPYCGNCNRDPDGERIYTCGSCGVSEPAYRMVTEVLCGSCWHKECSTSNFDKIKIRMKVG